MIKSSLVCLLGTILYSLENYKPMGDVAKKYICNIILRKVWCKVIEVVLKKPKRIFPVC